MSDGRKRLSGSEYMKRRVLKEDDDKKQNDALQRYFKPKRKRPSSGEGGKIGPESTETSGGTAATSLSSGNDQKVDEHSTATTAYINNADGGPSTICSTDLVWTQDMLCDESSEIETSGRTEIRRPDSENNGGTSAEVLTTGEGIEGEPKLEDTIDSDPGRWPEIITDCIRTTLVMRGPSERIKEAEEYPRSADNRHFSPVHYNYSLKNLEEADRHWLLYSKSEDAVFCFCCKLFSSSTVKIAKNGISDWRHLASYFESHGKSTEHLYSHKKWIVFSEGLKKSRTVDARHQRLLNTESEHCKNVLERLTAIIHFLGRQRLPLRESTDTLFQPDDGNFLKLVELFGKFDTVMMERLHRTKQGEKKGHHYLGKETHNEIIHLIGSSITNNILLMMKSAKYYSIILDCTPDISKVEQMTVVVRFVQETRLDGVYDVPIWEHFLGFLPVPDSSSSTLTQVVLKLLENLKKILLCNMREQGYDNGANMKGKKSGLQKRISDTNKRACYVPCNSHSWNLVVNDAAMSSKHAVSMFSTVKRLYDFLSSSVRCWDVLKKYLPNLSLKPLNDTRWESRIDALTPLRFQIGGVYDALVQISEEGHLHMTLPSQILNL
ncbi:zinc finger MYM-type protein 1-like [Schistocerca gregaria]|uniref:zinc finger MYM-type protein 1-like n=1 Tax=Schistocerca gregaria TaxID=7010 RepID=UPI00211DB779|nr:zinc finger MYM-type protein 1-like [Schistocerca gregaria]